MSFTAKSNGAIEIGYERLKDKVALESLEL